MPVVAPLAPEAAPQSTRSIYERISQTIGSGQVPLGYQMMGPVEPFLQDSYMNYRKFVEEGAGQLDVKTRQALVLATSSANNCTHCVRAHAKDAQAKGLSSQEIAEVLAVTATCAMYNVYYKFRELSGDEAFRAMSPGLRAHAFHKTSLDPKTVELISIVVSTINGCPSCTAGHVRKALELGLTREQIDEAAKVAATMTAFNVFHRTQ